MVVGGAPSLAPQTIRDVNAPPEYPAPSGAVDLEKVLPLAIVRQHTKTDDTPRVTNEMLSLYRSAAFESCEQYTGMVFTASRIVRENVTREGHRKRFRQHRTITLKYATVDDTVYLYGGGMLRPQAVLVTPGSRHIRIPVIQEALDASSCCDPCSRGGENFGVMVMYRTGILDATHVPAVVLLGCLKYIAWAIENPGDTVQTVKNRQSVGESGIVGTNNGAWASGAIEEWRQILPNAI